MCLRQAARLEELRGRLDAGGFGDTRLVILNAGSSAHAGLALQAAGGAVPVLQDYAIISPSIWELMGAAKDDIMVFDRCGRLTYHVIVPWSTLTYPYVKAALLSTYHDDPCGQCNITSISHNEEDHVDQQPNRAEGDPSSANASFAEHFLLAPQMVHPTLTPSLINQTTSESLEEDVETSIMAPPTMDPAAANAEEIVASLNSGGQIVEQERNNGEAETTTESSGEQDVKDSVPLRVIMRYPHSHWERGATVRKHDYLVMRTGDPDYHGHLEEEGVTQEVSDRADTQRNVIRRDDANDDAARGRGSLRGYPLWRNTWMNLKNSSVRIEENLVRARVGEDMQEEEVNREEVEGNQKEGTAAENSDEVEDSESQAIKQRMIEHYKKLLPWINYNL